MTFHFFFFHKKKSSKRKMVTFVQRMESEVVNDSSSYHVFFLTTFHFGSKRLKQPCIGLASFIIGSSEPPLALPPVTAEVSICTKSQTSYSIALFLVRAFWSKEKLVTCFIGGVFSWQNRSACGLV